MSTKTYSEDLRERVVRSVEEEGQSTREAGTRWQVSHNCVAQWVRRKRSTGSVAAKQRGGGKSHVLEGYKAWLLGWIARKSELTLKEMQALLLAHHGQQVGITTLWNFLRRPWYSMAL